MADETDIEATHSKSESTPWESISSMVSAGDKESLELELDLIGAKETFRSLSRLTTDEQQQLITLVDSEIASDLIEDMPDSQAARLIEGMVASDAAPIVSEMESHLAADLLGDIDAAKANKILDNITAVPTLVE